MIADKIAIKLKQQQAEWLDTQHYRNACLGVPDITLAKLIFPLESYAENVQQSLAYIEKSGKYQVDFIGNWWVEGNPYKGINVTLNPISKPRWKFALAKALWTRGLPTFGLRLPVKSELQLHTEESLSLADANQKLYEVARDKNQPLEQRRKAFDEMVEAFSKIAVPDNVETIGEPIVKSRPEPSDDEVMSALFKKIEDATGVTVQTIKPDYPHGLQELLDKARAIWPKQPNKALVYFEKAVQEYDDSSDLWVRRGVATALLNSGQILMAVERYDEAIDFFNRTIAKAGSDEKLELEALNAANYIETAEKRKKEGNK